jgi:hypothetical protein
MKDFAKDVLTNARISTSGVGVFLGSTSTRPEQVQSNQIEAKKSLTVDLIEVVKTRR